MKIYNLLFQMLIFTMALSINSANAEIVSTRPRVWINPTISDELHQNVSNSTLEWQQLKNWCDTYTNTDLNSGYRGQGWFKAIMNYGLCFQATDNQTYGNEGVKYLKALLDDHYNIGDGLGGDERFANDDGNGNGYLSRFVGVGVAVGRDWLDGANALDASLIDRVGTRVAFWLNYLITNPKGSVYAMDDPNDNFFSGHFSFFHTAAISLYGDTNYQQSWRTQADNMWTSLAKPNILSHLNGGDWQEGWNYGPLAVREQLLYMWGLALADTSHPDFSDVPWVDELIRSHLHGLHPNRQSFQDNGSWTGNTKGDPRKATMLLLSNMTTNQSLANLASWFTNTIQDGADEWENFLWSGKDLSPTIPTAASLNGLAYKIDGTSRVFTRSNEWSDTMATWVEFACPPTGSAGQDEANVGEFKIVSRGKKLIVDSDTYEYTSEYGNVLLINGTHTYAPKQEWWRDKVGIDRYENSSEYTYARGSDLANAYDAKLNNDPSASFYSREMLFVRPDYIFIMDSLTPTNKTINTIAGSLVHFQGNPTISNSTAQSINGNAKIFMDIRGHAVTLSKTDVSGTIIGTVNKVTISPIGTSSNYKLLHIFQTADATTPNMDTLTDIITEKVQGVQLGETVVLFNKSPTLVDITGSIVYTVSNTVNAHLLTGLTPGEKYNMSRTGDTVTLSNNGTDFTVSSNGILFISETGGNSNSGSEENSPSILMIRNN